MNQEKIGKFLKELRKTKGLTQEQLAEQFGVSSRSVSRWENGNNLPDLSLLIELSDFYDVDIRELMNGEKKGENMETELKETLVQAADYDSSLQEKLLKRVRIFSILGLTALMVHLILNGISYQKGLYILDYLDGLCIGLSAGAMITSLSFTTGHLMRKSEKKRKIKLMLAITLGIIAFIICFYCTEF